MISRRKLMLGSALATGGLSLMRVVQATTVQHEAPVSAGTASPPMTTACRFDAKHERLAADLRAKLGSTGMDPGSEITVTCPLCGCPITVASN
ncbi:MAG: hypothetical protein U1E45_19380 [Geminicoccaceae bacterium]